MKKNLSIIFLLIIAGLLLQNCTGTTNTSTGTWKNKQIDTGVRSTINGLNDQLFNYLIAKDATGLRKMMSPKLINSLGSMIDTIVKTAKIKYANDYELLDDYYTVNPAPNTPNLFSSNHGNDNDYTLSYKGSNTEAYASLFIDKKFIINRLVIAIYSKYDTGWKLDMLNLGKYTILHKTAPEYYDAALAQYHKGNFINAMDDLYISLDVFNPGGVCFKYKVRDDMKAFKAKVLDEANAKYHFPIKITGVKTAPQIFAVDPKFIVDNTFNGTYPIIKYQSVIPVKDTAALKVENLAVQKVIGKIFKGIDEDKDLILYQIYNELPDGKKFVANYSFAQQLKRDSLAKTPRQHQ